MKNLTKVLSIVIFGLSVGIANAEETGSQGGEGSDNVEKSRSYQENVVNKPTVESKESVAAEPKETTKQPSSWDGFQKDNEAD